MDIQITWNLFWTTIFVPICLVFFGWWLTQKDKKRDELKEKLEFKECENVQLRENIVDEWRETFVSALKRVEDKVTVLIGIIPTLVTKGDCVDSHEIFKDIMDDHRAVLDSHGNRITSLEAEVKHLQSWKGDH